MLHLKRRKRYEQADRSVVQIVAKQPISVILNATLYVQREEVVNDIQAL